MSGGPILPTAVVSPRNLHVQVARFYRTMDSVKIPLVEGESPLDKLLEILDVSQKEFSRRIGVDDSTLRRWKSGKSEARFSLHQMKALKKELESVGLALEDLPDSFSPYKSA